MSTSAIPAGPSNPHPARQAQAPTGHFMLTLCQLAAPVSIRPPQSPRLKRFTFFMSRARQPDGSEKLYLHMGYFETLAVAERWVQAVRRHYPNAFATIAPVKDESLTDTQVLKILETRRASAVENDADGTNRDQIALLRPEDTGVRRVLKEAVAQGAPVSFAVQLHWSARPIDLASVSSLPIFKPYRLYATESRREGRCCYFLRLGFFADPLSAKQVAAQVRSTYASAAVVPVVDQEVTRAHEAAMKTSAIPCLGEQRVDRESDSNVTSGSSTLSEPWSDAPRHVSSRRASRSTDAVGQTPEPPPARKRTWTDPDSLSESGVRHLRVEMQEHSSGRWKIVHFDAAAPDSMHVRGAST
jgi:hypothetical protein